MVIWARWGILGVLAPLAFILAAQSIATPPTADEPRPPRRVSGTDPEGETAAAAAAEGATARRREQEAERRREGKRAKANGFGVGSLLAAGALWPLGLWLNRTDTRTLVDQQSGQAVELGEGGGHTLFFIPLEYWAFLWAVIGLYKLAT